MYPIGGLPSPRRCAVLGTAVVALMLSLPVSANWRAASTEVPVGDTGVVQDTWITPRGDGRIAVNRS